MKKTIYAILVVLMFFFGCSNGPKDDIVKKDVTEQFVKMSKYPFKYEILSIDISDREKKGEDIIVMCNVKTNEAYTKFSGQVETLVKYFKVTVNYSKYDNTWVPKITTSSQ